MKRNEFDADFHPKDLVERMSNGEIDVQIYANWDISERTFYYWMNQHPELQSAFERGYPKWEAAWLKKGIQYMEDGKRDAFKYWDRIMAVKASQKYRREQQGTNNTTINVNNMNLLGSKSEAELKEILEGKLQKLNLLGNTIEVQAIDVTPKSE